ncbi:unnamed protein product [Rotaria magnacalcarata]|uniref:G-protein coupled receptors family 1 profile domain-containing protein n=1 Tax=Rotaria magnacalcarata TaxID=392030 RepID=A0A816E9Z4_9BILA|nr:unnamed protein product [Rotaria magnacalcarata]CAF1649793.1 unnamed protein product [Rotaria magnacalcarata]CAF2080841.1 unnamed protein product [Rotaria magnacalcarata]CAF2141139.1 unnamed protein product [Rotaria magnacalcarata]CAF4233070.1 unnamed protein product [Rotaria magnacalcarata]
MSTNNTTPITGDPIANSVKFAVLLAFEIPSIITSSIIVINIVVTPAFRSKEQNHSTCVLLSFNFLQIISDIPLAIHFFHLNIVQPATSVHCILWTWLDFTFNTSSLQLMAWISIERHLVIFSWNLTRRMSRLQRWFIHFAPLIICSVWCPIFYFFTIIVTPMCANTWIFDRLLCGLPCYLTTNWGYYDLIFNIIMPVLFILIANVAFVIRVIKQKLSRVRPTRVDWHRQRKMAFQLGILSMLFSLVWAPFCIIQLEMIYFTSDLLLQFDDFIVYLLYFIPLLLPFVLFLSRPEFMKNFKGLLFGKKQATVMPTTIK